MEQIISSYLRQVLGTNDWLYEGEHELILVTPLFLPYFNDNFRKTVSSIGHSADDCVIYRKIIINEYIENLEKLLDKLE
jgi:hypothetical protein